TAKFTLNGAEYTVDVPAGTGGWYAAEPKKASGEAMGAVSLAAGEQAFSITAGNAVWGYFDKFEFIPTEEKPEPEPDPGSDPVNGIVVEAENNQSGQGKVGGAASFGSASGGDCVRMWGDSATTLNYTVSIPEAGNYKVLVYVGSIETYASSAIFTLNGVEYMVDVPAGTGGWYAAEPTKMNGDAMGAVSLAAGTHAFSLTAESAVWGYFDKFEFIPTETDSGAEPEPDPVSGLLIEAETGKRDGNVIFSAKCDGHFVNVSGNGIRMQNSAASVSYTINIPADGRYDVEVYAGSIEGNSGRDKFVLDDVEYYVSVPLNTKPNLVAVPLETVVGQTVKGIALTAGQHAFQIVYDGADWCYYDKIVFRLSKDQGPVEAPDPAASLMIEAEKGRFVTGKGTGANVSDGDGNFTTVSGGSCIRMYGGPAQLDYTIEIPQDGYYQVQMTVGSRSDNSGRDKFLIEGGTYYVSVPAGASPEWRQVVLTTAENKEAAPVWLTAGPHTFSLVYDGAAWCYYDKIEFIPSRIFTKEDVKEAIDAMPAPEAVTANDKDAFAQVMHQYDMLSEEDRAWLAAADVRKLMLGQARCNALLADPGAPAHRYQYEFENGTLLGNTAIAGEAGAMRGYSGDGYIFVFDGGAIVRFYAPAAGFYRLSIAAGADDTGRKCDLVSINGGEELLTSAPAGNQYGWRVAAPGRERWSTSGRLDPQPAAAGFYLEEGWNELRLTASWGYACYDYFYIEPADGFDFDGFFTAEDVEKLAAALPEVDNVTLAHADTVKRAYKAYLTLLRSERDLLPSRPKLLMDNARINALVNMPGAPAGTLWYELEEDGVMRGNSCTSTSREVYSEYSGSGYVFIFDAAMEMDVFVPRTRTYNMWLMAGSNPTDDKCDYVWVNQGDRYLVAASAQANLWKRAVIGVEGYENGKVSPKFPEGGILLNEGQNLFEIVANWGYSAYDALILTPGTGSPITSKAARLLSSQIGPGWPSEDADGIIWENMENRELELLAQDGSAAMAPSGSMQGGALPLVWTVTGGAAAAGAAGGTAVFVRRRGFARKGKNR
ncbi:MAG: hypothetical protein HDT27_04895, partial [Subdoligranulum sp.]|nr:hypothetical protein [Subdoligranulum sp.]